MDHENIIKYIGSEIVSKHFWIYLECATEGSLLSAYKEYGPFEEDIIKIYTRQIVEGLWYLHQHKIVHHDIKWANILLMSDGVVKISDFGSAKILESNSSFWEYLPSLKGTIPWMAPEVLSQKSINCKADIWSLGCTVLEMATAKSPWDKQKIGNNIEDFFKLWDWCCHPEIPDYLSSDLKDFLNQWFIIDSTQRSSALDLLNHHFLKQ